MCARAGGASGDAARGPRIERGPNAGSLSVLDQPATSVGRHPRHASSGMYAFNPAAVASPKPVSSFHIRIISPVQPN
jgi:hypothetical protein